MRIPRIYIDQPLGTDCEIELGTDSVHYLAAVLRMKAGMALVAFDGSGMEFHGTLTALDRKSATARFTDAMRPATESPLLTELGIGISRGERMDYVVQKSTELGVRIIQPLFTEHCEVRLDDKRAAKRRDHWQQVAISACEQSGRLVPPKVLAPLPLAEWLDDVDYPCKFLLDQDKEHRLEEREKPEGVALLVGPEGGLSDNEKTLALGKGFSGLNLGARTLRTETAPVAALSLLQYLWGN